MMVGDNMTKLSRVEEEELVVPEFDAVVFVVVVMIVTQEDDLSNNQLLLVVLVIRRLCASLSFLYGCASVCVTTIHHLVRDKEEADVDFGSVVSIAGVVVKGKKTQSYHQTFLES
jgi:hypothetical protein